MLCANGDGDCVQIAPGVVCWSALGVVCVFVCGHCCTAVLGACCGGNAFERGVSWTRPPGSGVLPGAAARSERNTPAVSEIPEWRQDPAIGAMWRV